MQQVIRKCAKAILAAITPAILVGCGGGSDDHSTQPVADLSVATVSSRADFVTGGAALLEITVPPRAAGGSYTIVANGQEAPLKVGASSKPNAVIGVVTGLAEGETTIKVQVASAQGAVHTGSLAVKNTNRTAGTVTDPLKPIICRPDQLGLGAATDADCNTPTVYTYYYQSTNAAKSGLQPYDTKHPPTDVATTTTDAGTTVPFIVRDERGVIDRWVYDIVVLADPQRGWDATAPQAGWNHKLLWRFGGGCTPGHVQSSNSAQALDNSYNALGRGFAVATSGASVLGNHCNTTLSAEAVLMIKSHLAVNYGFVRYAISDGASGGSIQQHGIANNYPGLLDGLIITGTSFPDILSVGTEFADCHLLRRYFSGAGAALWANAPAQQAAVMGKPDLMSCQSVDTNAFSLGDSFENFVYNPSIGCLYPDNAMPPVFSGTLPSPGVYDARANPKGVRCTYQDSLIAIYGKRPIDGFANRPFDNVGVQYGLAALKQGTITASQFIDLNRNIGGIDIDDDWQATRTAGDLPSLSAAYKSGQVVDGKALGNVPIIAYQRYNNQTFHDTFYNWQLRARLTAANGHANNQVIWTYSGTPDALVLDAFLAMDNWLSGIESDSSQDDQSTKLAKHKRPRRSTHVW